MVKTNYAIPVAMLLSLSTASAANYATSVSGYSPGSNAQSGYTTPSVALGAPSVDTGFGEVTPFNTEFRAEHILSIGTGGVLTLAFSSPIVNDALNPFGIDFVIIGTALFLDTDFPNGRTDATGSMFSNNPGNNPGTTRVSVSADGVNFFVLDESIAPVVDSLFPTDSAGNFERPVDPSLLAPGTFANKSLAEIRALYAGSAGGTPFDIGWAEDALGNPVTLPQVSAVRIEVLQGNSEIDAIVDIAPVPEPSTWIGLVFGSAVILAAKRRRK